eukprot:5873732-Amphidinium_carterae.2
MAQDCIVIYAADSTPMQLDASGFSLRHRAGTIGGAHTPQVKKDHNQCQLLEEHWSWIIN